MADKITASHILLTYQGAQRARTARSRADARTQMDALAAQIASGGDFAELARAHSECPSARNGGSLGAFGKGQMVGAFEEAAFKLPVGGTSDVVETGFGYHLIQRTA